MPICLCEDKSSQILLHKLNKRWVLSVWFIISFVVTRKILYLASFLKKWSRLGVFLDTFYKVSSMIVRTWQSLNQKTPFIPIWYQRFDSLNLRHLTDRWQPWITMISKKICGINIKILFADKMKKIEFKNLFIVQIESTILVSSRL